MNNVKLVYTFDGHVNVVPMNTKKGAQMLDRFLKEEYDGYGYSSKLIYDEEPIESAEDYLARTATDAEWQRVGQL